MYYHLVGVWLPGSPFLDVGCHCPLLVLTTIGLPTYAFLLIGITHILPYVKALVTHALPRIEWTVLSHFISLLFLLVEIIWSWEIHRVILALLSS